MKIELEFCPPEGEQRTSVRIILDPEGESPMSGLPTVTKNCVSYDELETQLLVIEKQISKIRREAAKFFKVPVKDA